jgi:hypothetical protein
MSSGATADSIVERLGASYQALPGQRYPVMVVIYRSRSALPLEQLRSRAQAVGAEFVDMIAEASGGSTQILPGAFRRHHFLEWLRRKAQATGGVWVDNGDAIITTWPEPERRAFFMELLKTESRGPETGAAAPIVLFSRLAADQDLPQEPRGQGLVIHL